MGPGAYPSQIRRVSSAGSAERRRASACVGTSRAPFVDSPYHRLCSAHRRRDEMADMPDSKSGGWQRPCRLNLTAGKKLLVGQEDRSRPSNDGASAPPRQAGGIPIRVPKKVPPATSATRAHKARRSRRVNQRLWYTALWKESGRGSACPRHVLS